MRGSHREAKRLDFVEAGGHQKAFGVVAKNVAGFANRVKRAVNDGDYVFGRRAYLHADDVKTGIGHQARDAHQFPKPNWNFWIFAGGHKARDFSYGNFFGVAGAGNVANASFVNAWQNAFHCFHDKLGAVVRRNKALCQNSDVGVAVGDVLYAKNLFNRRRKVKRRRGKNQKFLAVRDFLYVCGSL